MSQQTRPFIQEQRNLIAKDHALFREMMKGIELRNTEFFNKMNTIQTAQDEAMKKIDEIRAEQAPSVMSKVIEGYQSNLMNTLCLHNMRM